MKTITLASGENALVDDEDYPLVSQYKWQLLHGYPRAWGRTDGKRKNILMHQLIMPCLPCFEPDHIDGNKLNNQRQNLRPATRSQNNANRGPQRNNTTGFKGVYLKRNTGRYLAQIQVNKRIIYLGYHDTPEDAARAYDQAARRYFGPFAHTNFEED